jgi:hypothetical protein
MYICVAVAVAVVIVVTVVVSDDDDDDDDCKRNNYTVGWGSAFARNSPFDAKMCHPAGTRALFADYQVAPDDEFTHTVKASASGAQ